MLNWRRDELGSRRNLYIGLAFASLVVAIIVAVIFSRLGDTLEVTAVAALGLTLWLFASVLHGLYHRVRNKRNNKLAAAMQASGAFWGMTLAHLGLGVFTLGVALVSIHAEETTVRMAPGDSHVIGGYEFTFANIAERRGPNFDAVTGAFEFRKLDAQGETRGRTGTVYAEKRFYDVRRETMTEAGIDGNLSRDLFIALGEPLDGGAAWSVRLQVKPLIRWIWLGTLFMTAGGIVAALDRRYRPAVRRESLTARQTARADDPAAGHAGGRLTEPASGDSATAARGTS